MLDFSRPEHLDDIAPAAAAAVMRCREQALAWLVAHDYQLVIPPLADYLETLTGGDDDLDLQTFKITDTLSGRTLGIRADQTPQIARFDADIADKPSLRRYCYCGSTLRATPPQPWQGRESMQLGAELFGAPAGGGDWEIASVALGTLNAMGIDSLCIDLGHAGLFTELTADLSSTLRRQLQVLVGRRDAAGVQALMDSGVITAEVGASLLILAKTAGGGEVLEAASAAMPAAALETLDVVWRQLRAEQYDCGISLSDLGSYGYHSGVVFSIYAKGRLIARGGRYQRQEGDDGVGFSIDLRAVYALVPPLPLLPPVNVPLAPEDGAWWRQVAALRVARRRLRFVYGDDEPPPPLLRRGRDVWMVQEK